MISHIACIEVRKNLALKRPAWMPVFEELAVPVEVVPTVVFQLPVSLAAKDIPLLCAAIRAECELFVTGDRTDFGQLFDKTVLGTTVITPLELARRIQGGLLEE